MTLLAEDLLLLLLDDATGKPVVDSTRLDRVLSGAVLLELALQERIAPAAPGEQVRKGRLAVRNSTPLGDALLDATLTRLADRPVRPERAVEQVVRGLRATLLTRLTERGLVRRERRQVLGIFPVTRYPATEPGHEVRLHAELEQVLVHGVQPSTRTAALVSLLSAVDAVGKVVAGDRRLLKRRAKQIAEGEWAGAAVRRAVDAVTAATVATMVAVTAATTTSTG